MSKSRDTLKIVYIAIEAAVAAMDLEAHRLDLASREEIALSSSYPPEHYERKGILWARRMLIGCLKGERIKAELAEKVKQLYNTEED